MSGEFKLSNSNTGNYWKIEDGKRKFFDKTGKSIDESLFLEQEGAVIKYGKICKLVKNDTYTESSKKNTVLQKQSAEQIVKDLKKAIKGLNDNNAIKAALSRIDNPDELKEVEKLLEAEGYKADDMYSVVEKFIAKELDDYSVEDNIQKWIKNGTLKGQDANSAQARLAARIIRKGGDGMGTDCDEIKRGIRLIKAPKETGNIAVDKANAKAVYARVNYIIQKAHNESLEEYLDGEMWDGEVKELMGILAENNAIQDENKAKSVKELVREAVEGAGTDVDTLSKALKAINSHADRVAVEKELQAYCKEKGIKPQIHGQDALQAIFYDELDTFAGLSTDHKEIRKFNEMLISQGAYNEDEVVKIKSEQAALQILEGDYENIKDAIEQIKDPKILKVVEQLLTTKNEKSLEDFLNKNIKDQTKRDTIYAELASNGLLKDDNAAGVAFRLLQSKDYNTRAMGLKAIRTNKVMTAVDEKLKESGTSLAEVMNKFNAEKQSYKTKAAFWDGLAYIPGLSTAAESVSDKYRKHTDISDNLYVESEEAVEVDANKQKAYMTAVQILEGDLNRMKSDYQTALDNEGIVSGAVNSFVSVYNIGTSRDDIEARIEHDEETVRLLKLAAEGKLTKADGTPASFEDVFKERQSEFITANGASISAIINAVKSKDVTEFDANKINKVSQQAETLAAMEFSKDYILDGWSELNQGIKSNNDKQLSIAVIETADKLKQLTTMDCLSEIGLQVKDGTVVDESGREVSSDKLQEAAAYLKQCLSGVTNLIYGKTIPENADNEDVSEIIDDGVESRKEEFKEEYKAAFGQEPTDEMLESYLSTINTGTMVVNIGAAIAATILTAGYGSVAVFAAVGATSFALNAAEHSTDANGFTNSEIAQDAEQALWDGALGAVGVKVGMYAEKFATNANVLLKNKAMLSKVLDKFNLSNKAMNKITYWTTRVEAAGGEISSDALQAIVQEYCMNGEVSEEGFLRAMIMSAGFNTIGHVTSGVSGKVHNGNLKSEIKADMEAEAIRTKEMVTGKKGTVSKEHNYDLYPVKESNNPVSEEFRRAMDNLNDAVKSEQGNTIGQLVESNPLFAKFKDELEGFDDYVIVDLDDATNTATGRHNVDKNGREIALNLDALKNNEEAFVNTLMHEVEHAKQQRTYTKYKLKKNPTASEKKYIAAYDKMVKADKVRSKYYDKNKNIIDKFAKETNGLSEQELKEYFNKLSKEQQAAISQYLKLYNEYKINVLEVEARNAGKEAVKKYKAGENNGQTTRTGDDRAPQNDAAGDTKRDVGSEPRNESVESRENTESGRNKGINDSTTVRDNDHTIELKTASEIENEFGIKPSQKGTKFEVTRYDEKSVVGNRIVVKELENGNLIKEYGYSPVHNLEYESVYDGNKVIRTDYENSNIKRKLYETTTTTKEDGSKEVVTYLYKDGKIDSSTRKVEITPAPKKTKGAETGAKPEFVLDANSSNMPKTLAEAKELAKKYPNIEVKEYAYVIKDSSSNTETWVKFDSNDLNSVRKVEFNSSKEMTFAEEKYTNGGLKTEKYEYFEDGKTPKKDVITQKTNNSTTIETVEYDTKKRTVKQINENYSEEIVSNLDGTQVSQRIQAANDNYPNLVVDLVNNRKIYEDIKHDVYVVENGVKRPATADETAELRNNKWSWDNKPVTEPVIKPAETEPMIKPEFKTVDEFRTSIKDSGIDEKSLISSFSGTSGRVSYSKNGLEYNATYQDGVLVTMKVTDAKNKVSYYTSEKGAVKEISDADYWNLKNKFNIEKGFFLGLELPDGTVKRYSDLSYDEALTLSETNPNIKVNPDSESYTITEPLLDATRTVKYFEQDGKKFKEISFSSADKPMYEVYNENYDAWLIAEESEIPAAINPEPDVSAETVQRVNETRQKQKPQYRLLGAKRSVRDIVYDTGSTMFDNIKESINSMRDINDYHSVVAKIKKELAFDKELMTDLLKKANAKAKKFLPKRKGKPESYTENGNTVEIDYRKTTFGQKRSQERVLNQDGDLVEKRYFNNDGKTLKYKEQYFDDYALDITYDKKGNPVSAQKYSYKDDSRTSLQLEKSYTYDKDLDTFIIENGGVISTIPGIDSIKYFDDIDGNRVMRTYENADGYTVTQIKDSDGSWVDKAGNSKRTKPSKSEDGTKVKTKKDGSTIETIKTGDDSKKIYKDKDGNVTRTEFYKDGEIVSAEYANEYGPVNELYSDGELVRKELTNETGDKVIHHYGKGDIRYSEFFDKTTGQMTFERKYLRNGNKEELVYRDGVLSEKKLITKKDVTLLETYYASDGVTITSKIEYFGDKGLLISYELDGTPESTNKYIKENGKWTLTDKYTFNSEKNVFELKDDAGNIISIAEYDQVSHKWVEKDTKGKETKLERKPESHKVRNSIAGAAVLGAAGYGAYELLDIDTAGNQQASMPVEDTNETEEKTEEDSTPETSTPETTVTTPEKETTEETEETTEETEETTDETTEETETESEPETGTSDTTTPTVTTPQTPTEPSAAPPAVTTPKTTTPVIKEEIPQLEEPAAGPVQEIIKGTPPQVTIPSPGINIEPPKVEDPVPVTGYESEKVTINEKDLVNGTDPETGKKTEIEPQERMAITMHIMTAKTKGDIKAIQKEMKSFKRFKGRKNLRRALKAKRKELKHPDNPNTVKNEQEKYTDKYQKKIGKVIDSEVFNSDLETVKKAKEKNPFMQEI